MPARNSSTTELVGWFWSFEDERARLPGTLQMDPDGRMTLIVINQVSSPDQVIGAFEMPFEGVRRSWYLGGRDLRLAGLVSGTTVSGRSVRDEDITLDGCHCLTLGTMQQPRRITFTVNLAYIGIALPETEDLVSRKAACHAEGVEGWLNPGGPKLSERMNLSPSAEIETIADVEGLGRTTVKMVASKSFSRKRGNTVEVQEYGHFALSLTAPATWSNMSDCLYSTHRFIRFALNSLCVVKQILVDVDGRPVEVVEQAMRDHKGKPYRPFEVPRKAIFTADTKEQRVVGSAPEVLRRWLELPRGARGTLLRLHGLMIADEFLESQAVSVCGAGELWSTQILGLNDCEQSVSVEPLDEPARKKIEEIFVENGWQRVYSRRVRPILDSPNELSTGEKVRGLFDPIEREATNLSPDAPCEISTKLLSLRHPLSHGGVGSCMSTAEMSRVVKKSHAILKLAVLDYLGVEWKTIARYNRTLRWELGLDTGWHALPYPEAEDEEAE